MYLVISLQIKDLFHIIYDKSDTDVSSSKSCPHYENFKNCKYCPSCGIFIRIKQSTVTNYYLNELFEQNKFLQLVHEERGVNEMVKTMVLNDYKLNINGKEFSICADDTSTYNTHLSEEYCSYCHVNYEDFLNSTDSEEYIYIICYEFEDYHPKPNDFVQALKIITFFETYLPNVNFEFCEFPTYIEKDHDCSCD